MPGGLRRSSQQLAKTSTRILKLTSKGRRKPRPLTSARVVSTTGQRKAGWEGLNLRCGQCQLKLTHTKNRKSSSWSSCALEGKPCKHWDFGVLHAVEASARPRPCEEFLQALPYAQPQTTPSPTSTSTIHHSRVRGQWHMVIFSLRAEAKAKPSMLCSAKARTGPFHNCFVTGMLRVAATLAGHFSSARSVFGLLDAGSKVCGFVS